MTHDLATLYSVAAAAGEGKEGRERNRRLSAFVNIKNAPSLDAKRAPM